MDKKKIEEKIDSAKHICQEIHKDVRKYSKDNTMILGLQKSIDMDTEEIMAFLANIRYMVNK